MSRSRRRRLRRLVCQGGLLQSGAPVERDGASGPVSVSLAAQVKLCRWRGGSAAGHGAFSSLCWGRGGVGLPRGCAVEGRCGLLRAGDAARVVESRGGFVRVRAGAEAALMAPSPPSSRPLPVSKESSSPEQTPPRPELEGAGRVCSTSPCLGPWPGIRKGVVVFPYTMEVPSS